MVIIDNGMRRKLHDGETAQGRCSLGADALAETLGQVPRAVGLDAR
jgi:hypothetical protein